MRIACIGARLEKMTGNGWQGAQVSMNILVMIPELHSIPFKFLDAFKFLFESVDEGTQREKVGRTRVNLVKARASYGNGVFLKLLGRTEKACWGSTEKCTVGKTRQAG
jgi:hypothetical protein